MWYRAVGGLVTLTLSLLVVPRLATAQPQEKLPLVGVLEPVPQQPLRAVSRASSRGCGTSAMWRGQPSSTIAMPRITLIAFRPSLAELVQRAPTSSGCIRRRRWWPPGGQPRPSIVMGLSSDLLEQGLVASLARPGGNLTGMDFRVAELVAKQLEVLKEAVPPITRVAVLVDPNVPHHQGEHPPRASLASAGRAAPAGGGGRSCGLRGGLRRHGPREGRRAADREYGLLQCPPPAAPGSGAPVSAPDHVVRAALCRGGDLALGADSRELCQRSTVFVHKILHGATPRDLPIERVDKFPLVINLKTARPWA